MNNQGKDFYFKNLKQYFIKNEDGYFLTTSGKEHTYYKNFNLSPNKKYKCVEIAIGSIQHISYVILNDDSVEIDLFNTFEEFSKIFINISEIRDQKLDSIL